VATSCSSQITPLTNTSARATSHESSRSCGVASFRRASFAAAAARARAEIASRGLVVTVVQSYYAVAAGQQKLEAAQKAAGEGDRFLKLTQDLEHGGEVAHSDAIKAELQAQERRRQLQEAQLALLNARLNLAVLIFPDFNDKLRSSDDLHAVATLKSGKISTARLSLALSSASCASCN